MTDSVVIDAKRILLRYGVPIRVLDKIKEKQRIAFAREVSRTPVPDRGDRLRELLLENKFITPEEAAEAAKRSRRGKKRAPKPANN